MMFKEYGGGWFKITEATETHVDSSSHAVFFGSRATVPFVQDLWSVVKVPKKYLMAQFHLAQLHLDQVFKCAVHGGGMGIFSKGNADHWSLCWASWNLPQSNDDSHAQGTHCKAIDVQIFQIPFSRCARPKRGHLFPGGIKIIQAIFLQISYLTQHFHRFEYHVHFIPNLSHPWKEHLSPLTFMTLWQLSFQYQTSRVPWTEAGLVQNPWSLFGKTHHLRRHHGSWDKAEAESENGESRREEKTKGEEDRPLSPSQP